MKKLIIISDTQGYLVLTLKEKLESFQYTVEIVPPNPDTISRVTEKICGIILYGDEKLVANTRALIYIKDKAVEEDIPIFAIGTADELGGIEGAIMAQTIRQKFLRPINVVELVEALDHYISKFGNDNKKKILVVDDSGAMLRNVKAWLEDHYQVVLANSGTMAIKYLATNRPDLVLLDYEMPVINGKQVLEMIRSEQEFSDIPVIFLTSKGDKESVMQVMALKPEGYLLKTMEPAKIIQTVDEFFEKRKGII